MRFRKPLKITSRTSSVANGFVQAILPWAEPTTDERHQGLHILEIDAEKLTCCYCGSPATDWDHLNPLVRGKRPSGHISDYRNLVPSCGPCNQSKSGADWKKWMFGNAKGSPARRGIVDIDQRAARLTAFEAWAEARPLDLAKIVGEELWESYWQKLEQIERLMFEAQETAVIINKQLASWAVDAERQQKPCGRIER